MLRRLLLTTALFAPLLSAQSVVRVLGSNVAKGALQKLLPEFERSSNVKVKVIWGASGELRRRAEAGEPFDLAILTGAAFDGMLSENRLDRASRVNLGSVKLAVGAKSGAQKSDVGTAEGMKRRLLAARSVTYSRDGAGVPAFQRMIAALGIEQQMRPKLFADPLAGRGGESVVKGEHELSFAPASEIMEYPGAIVLGLFPPDFQSPISVSMASSANARNARNANALAQFLLKPVSRRIFRESGVDAP